MTNALCDFKILRDRQSQAGQVQFSSPIEFKYEKLDSFDQFQ